MNRDVRTCQNSPKWRRCAMSTQWLSPPKIKTKTKTEITTRSDSISCPSPTYPFPIEHHSNTNHRSLTTYIGRFQRMLIRICIAFICLGVYTAAVFVVSTHCIITSLVQYTTFSVSSSARML